LATSLTAGSLDFGLTSNEFRDLGLGLTVIFGIIILIPSYFLGEAYIHEKRRNRQLEYQYAADDFDVEDPSSNREE
jgi:hypothetical protein